MGASIPINSPEGKTLFEVPPGRISGGHFAWMVRACLRRGGRGNLYVYVKIRSVSAESAEQLALWKALKDAYTQG